MQCSKFGTTLAPEACVKRQEVARRGYVTKTVQANDGNSRDFQTEMPSSFKACVNCTTGKLVKLFPGRFIKKDFENLIRDQLKILRERGYIFRDEIDLICIVVSEKNESLDEDNRIVLIDHIAKISKKLVTERKINGKPHKILSATGCRIARCLRKQRCAERNQQANSSSTRT